jgi:hypothetical protein
MKEQELFDLISKKQRRFWAFLIAWFVFALFFVIITTQILTDVPDAFVYAGFYGGALLLFFIPIRALLRLPCPNCHKPALRIGPQKLAAPVGPLFTYRIVYCHSCGNRFDRPEPKHH